MLKVGGIVLCGGQSKRMGRPKAWLPFAGEAVTFDGVTCCIFVDEFGDGEIRVELVPEREDERDQWPLDVLRLSKDRQEEILNQLT